MMNGLRWFPIIAALMAASTLESEAAFKERALQIGIEERHVEKFVEKRFAAFGRYAFAVVYSPHHTDEAPLRRFLTDLLEEEPSLDQLSCMRRLFFEAHTMPLTDARQRVEASPDPGMATRKLATAERVARHREQESRLGGLVFTPETTPSNHLVDLFVEMCETGILSYIKPEQCCSRAQEVSAVRRDPTVSTDALGMLKLGAKTMDPTCEANTELKLRACWQRRNLAMDLAGLASFDVVEALKDGSNSSSCSCCGSNPGALQRFHCSKFWTAINSCLPWPHIEPWGTYRKELMRQNLWTPPSTA